MLAVYFEGLADERQAIDPWPYLRIEGNLLRSPSGDEIAVYKNSVWEVGGSSFLVLVIDSPVLIHFEDRGGRAKTLGPFTLARITDDILWTSSPAAASIAQLDEAAGIWQCADDHSHWPALLLKPAEV